MQLGVRFAHGVQFRMSKGALLSQTCGQVNTGMPAQHVCASVFDQRESSHGKEQKKMRTCRGGGGVK